MPRARMPSWLRPLGDVADPSASLFRRIRRSMTLLYTAVLVATLLLAGTVLYFSAQHRFMDQTLLSLDQSTQSAAQTWASELPSSNLTPCALVQGSDRNPTLVACYNGHGALTSASPFALALTPFSTDTTLVKRALASSSGCATDQITTTSPDAIDVPPSYRIVEREACVASGANNAVIGVVQVGAPIGDTVRALRLLLILMLAVGGFTVVISAVGGFILSARAMAPARLAYERQQRFIGDVSHELRTPLTLLRADAEMLLRGRDRLPEDDAELLDDIVDETARLATLTTSLLTLARLDSGNHLAERETLDLAEVAANVVRRTSAFAGDRQVDVRAVATDGLFVNGARDLIDQAALILVDNAIKYNRPGGHAEVRAERRGARVALVVRDDGPGVAPEHLERLGERFYRPDKARTRQPGQDGGSGLGISIARSIAALHGGALTFASADGQGLTATMELPAARMRHEPPSAPEHEAPAEPPSVVHP
ncbi:MAG TPA: HAMP domain-containing sensor histidine kinase [Ktedonobacterales bacterium]|nr:HAMP domain-containing sensor histidine kinase [Ktedonobacterales bacterium]